MRSDLLHRYGSPAIGALLLGAVMLRLLTPPPGVSPLVVPMPDDISVTVTAPRPAVPSFDIVRASAFGDTVMAGRATPGATVIVLDGEVEMGRARADRRGEWVVVPDMALAPGAHSLYVRAETPDGFRQDNDEPVVLLIPDRSDLPAVTLAHTDGRGGTVKHSEPVFGGSVYITAATRLGEDGLFVMGKAPAGTELIVYVDSMPIGRVEPDSRNRWRVATRITVRNGRYALRADQMAEGEVVARAAAILEIGLPKLVSLYGGDTDWLDFEDGIPVLIEGGGRSLVSRTPGRGPSVRY